jgi:hypothetical protein
MAEAAEAAPVQGASPPVQGAPPFDPSQNVLNLVEAGLKRQDDLRNSDARHAGEMREAARAYEVRLDAKDEQIRVGEKERIDAIRSVDVGAATILAAQVAASAEALRGQVEASRQQIATAQAAELQPMKTAIEELRRAQYETQGKNTGAVETSSSVRDDLTLETAKIQAAQTTEQLRIQSAQARMQLYALVLAAIIVALGLYAAFHK